MKGTYLLFLVFEEGRTVTAGSLGTLDIRPGEYCYAGSAMNGLEGRIGRHMEREKKMHWHIDRLTVCADRMESYVSADVPVTECTLADMARDAGCKEAFKGFGCSDCGCRTHLFLTDGGSKQKLINISGTTPFLRDSV